MSSSSEQPVELVPAREPLLPIVLSSPHSGSIYPPSLLDRTRLGLDQLRRLEDPFVHRLVAGGPALGAPLVHARFARAFVDPNREPYELDPALLRNPPATLTVSAKAQAGLGTLPTRIGGRPVYRGRLHFEDVETRLAQAYWPYHHALGRLIEHARGRFGVVLLLDCHSMPSLAQQGDGGGAVDVALGDRFGRSASPRVVEGAEACLRNQGFTVARNRPYAGGFITNHYGRPEAGVHALQIEMRRSLYMDERHLLPNGGFDRVARALEVLIAALADTVLDELAPAEAGQAGGIGLPSTG